MVYEGLLIFDSNVYGRDPNGCSRVVDDLIKSAGGKVLASRLWEERRLAYPIRGHRKGAYWLTYFEIDGSKISGMNHQCLINEMVLRHLFLKVDPRLADTLITHAKAEVKKETPPPAAKPKAPELAVEEVPDLGNVP